MHTPVFTSSTVFGLASLLLLGGTLISQAEAEAGRVRQHSERQGSAQLARAGFAWASLSIADDVGRIEGQAPSPAERRRAMQAARELLAPDMGWPGVFARLDDAMQLAPPAQPAMPALALREVAATTPAQDCGIGLAVALGEDRITFESGSSALTPASLALLRHVAPTVSACGATADALTVQGHTDRQGVADLNQRLSLRRAQAVVDALAAAGVPAQRLRAEGLGASQPLAQGQDEASNALNRRIEFRWTPSAPTAFPQATAPRTTARQAA